MKKVLALVTCVALLTAGCASAGGPRLGGAPAAPAVDASVMADYAQRLPPGSRVRVETVSGESMRATLMKATAQALTVQRHTRVPEPPFEIPLSSVARLTLDDARGASTAKAVGIGIASGVGTFFGILAILAATWSD